MSNFNLNGNDVLRDALEKLEINLPELVAMTSIWASPEYCNELRAKTGSSVRYKARRKRVDEKKGSVIDGIKIDDNTYANNAIKQAIGIKREDIQNFNTCHIYEQTCYDERYHTRIENLVLIPNAIAQLSDNFPDVINCLKYRAFELYGWYPEECGEPVKPVNYPTNWRKPIVNTFDEKQILEIEKNIDFEIKILEAQEFSIGKEEEEIMKVKNKVPKWFRSEGQINHKILLTFLQLLESNEKPYVSRNELKELCSKHIATYTTNFSQMSCFGIKNHGKVFEIDRDNVWLWKPVAEFVLSEYQKYLETENEF